METIASFGYWVRRRRKALDLTQETLASEVGCAPITIRKIERDERRPSRQMAERLATCLAIPASAHDRFIAAGLGEHAVDALAAPEKSPAVVPRARRKSTGSPAKALPEARFVGREEELARLQADLDAGSAGNGQVVFIAGEAGRGKTALMQEFARKAQETRSDLVVAWGSCSSLTGSSIPYLPLRDILITLTGDLETRGQAARLTDRQAEHLLEFAPTVAHTIVTTGPHLIDTLIPRRHLLSRLSAEHHALLPTQPRQTGLGGELQQRQIAEQITAVLQTLAETRTLLLLLDDLQWADTASTDLLFHLGHRLAQSRVLLVCAYRPSEIATDAADRGGHALTRLILEFRRRFGKTEIDLEQFDPRQARRLVDALLDREPNHLSDAFRTKLFWQTRGHPLFALELLREMKAQAHLVQDGAGFWREHGPVNWETLPTRVAAVIEQRLARLAEEEREILAVAGVEGERFTAEVIAGVLDIEEMRLLRVLSRVLEQRHGLVQESPGAIVDGRRLTPYQFGHVLYQHYLYESLGPSLRQHLHGRIAAQLEALHRSNPEPVLVQLARHYAAAGDNRKAAYYFTQVGHRARALHALADALSAYEQAAAALQQLRAGLSRAEIDATQPQYIELLLYRALLLPTAGRPPIEQKSLLEEAEGLLPTLMTTERRDPAHDRLEALLYYCRAIYLAKTAAYEEAATTALEGHTRYRRLSTPLMAAACLAEAGEAKLRISQNKTARHYFQEARALYESVHDATGESRCLSGLAWAALNLSDVEGALADLDTALSLNQHHQDTLGQAQVLFTLAAAWTYYYHPSRIRRYAHEALRLFRAMGYQAMTLRAAVYEALAMRMDGNLVEAAQQFMHIHRKAQRAQDSWLAGWTAQSLGRLALQSGRAAEAEQWLESARQSRRRSGELQNQVSDLAWLGRLRLSQGRVDAAVACTTAAVEQLEASLDEYYVFETPDVFLCHAESLTAAGRKDDATPFIRRAHDELQTFARKIRDPKVKAQYLDYWVSRRILESWQLGEARPLYPGRPT